jgi:hypothetical protein
MTKPQPFARVTSLLELTKWHIVRYDVMRNATSTKASVALSANAVIVTGTILLTGHTVTRSPWSSLVQSLLFALSMVISVILSLISILYAIRTLASRPKWRASIDAESSLGFSSLSTRAHARSNLEFQDMLRQASDERILRAAMTELWVGLLAYGHRYAHLQKSIYWLFWALLSFVISALVFISTSLVTRLLG